MVRLIAAGLLALVLATPAAARADAPVVLELFTSQGCSSCPPADALLDRLRGDPGVLPLGLHVDYWNRLGWRDPFSDAAFTARQEAYGRRLGQDGVYTPELVIDGAEGVVGSDPGAVAAAIRRARAAARPTVTLDLRRAPAGLAITVGGGPGQGQVLLLGYDDRHETPVGNGENGGRVLVDVNVVRSMQPVAEWSGATLRLAVAAPPGQHAAVLLQAGDGRIVAAASVP